MLGHFHNTRRLVRPDAPMDQEDWMSVNDVAERLGVSPQKIYKMAQEGDIPAEKDGGRWKFDIYEIETWWYNKGKHSEATKEGNLVEGRAGGSLVGGSEPEIDARADTTKEHLVDPREENSIEGILGGSQIDSSEREKAGRLIEYLRQLTQLRYKPVRNISSYEDILWLSDIPHKQGCFTQAWGRDEDYDPDIWAEIKSRNEPKIPSVPKACKRWIERAELHKKDSIPELKAQIKFPIDNPEWEEGSDRPEHLWQEDFLNGHPEVKEEWERYLKEKWRPWAKDHNDWDSVREVYAKLFAIREEIRRRGEECELILGIGLLTWNTSKGTRIRRHLLVANASLEFDKDQGEFTVRAHPEGAKLRPELEMLDTAADLHGTTEETVIEGLSPANDDPWERFHIDGALRTLAHSAEAHGEYREALEHMSPSSAPKSPVIEYAPAFILRKRSSKGLAEILKSIGEQIEEGSEIPDEFISLTGVREQCESEPFGTRGGNGSSPPSEIFFPKPFNEEQRRITQVIQTRDGVLVQGPPGTGKSHTIANLICHLLATGQQVLVTAKTPRALQVLNDLVPDELQPLCINLLGDGLEERQSRETSVKGILRKNEEWKPDIVDTECAALGSLLREKREERASVDHQLLAIRESETHSTVVADGAYKGTAAEIAEAVNRARAEYAWFTDTIPLDQPREITADEFRGVLYALRELPEDERAGQDLDWVGKLSIPLPDDFAILVSDEKRAKEEESRAEDKSDGQIVFLLQQGDEGTLEDIYHAFSALRGRYQSLLAMPHPWIGDAVRDALGGDPRAWQDRLRAMYDAITSIEADVSAADEVRFDSDTANLKQMYEDAYTIKMHMEKGGALGWGWGWAQVRPKLVRERLYVIDAMKSRGYPCSATAHFLKFATAIRVRMECEKAQEFWQGLGEAFGGPYALRLSQFQSLCEILEKILFLKEDIATCKEAVAKFSGLGEPVWADDPEIEKVILACQCVQASRRREQATKNIEGIRNKISDMDHKGTMPQAVSNLLKAIENRDIDQFKNFVSVSSGLRDLPRLRSLLPDLTKLLEETCGEAHWAGRVQQFDDAWRWAQARFWVEDYIQKGDVSALAKKAKRLEGDIANAITELASLRAWQFCFSRLEDRHRRHMEAWQQAMRRLGKGTGKHARRHRDDAKKHLDGCRDAVPAWVMPLHRVWDTISPTPRMFDVIIVDEASQCGVEALPLLYLGKKVLIVGDDKQISPDAVGVSREAAHGLMEKYLYDFDFKSSFDVESSLFDHGKLLHGARRITLREHFRCMPEIIRFSNDLCYADTPLIPLRQYGEDRLPPLEHVHVVGGYREGDRNNVINPPEADAIVERIEKMCGDPRYDGKTMGVVTLQGNAQGKLIEGKLLDRLGDKEMHRRHLSCGNPYSFQGGERDIMLLSMVASRLTAEGEHGRIGSLTRPADERRFNVAASRARDMMILFHSVTQEDLSETDLRCRLMSFFESPQRPIRGIDKHKLERQAHGADRGAEDPPEPFDSWFEVDVALEFLRRNYTVRAQHEVAGRRIDLVVVGGQRQLAVECDGDTWHGPDNYEKDMQRQRILERCGWEFVRIRQSAFYLDRERELQRLWPQLEERGIYPNLPFTDTTNDAGEDTANDKVRPDMRS